MKRENLRSFILAAAAISAPTGMASFAAREETPGEYAARQVLNYQPKYPKTHYPPSNLRPTYKTPSQLKGAARSMNKIAKLMRIARPKGK